MQEANERWRCKKKGLGKGLDSLIPDNKPAKKNTETVQKAEEKKEEMKDGVQMMKISMNRTKPRAAEKEVRGRCIT